MNAHDPNSHSPPQTIHVEVAKPWHELTHNPGDHARIPLALMQQPRHAAAFARAEIFCSNARQHLYRETTHNLATAIGLKRAKTAGDILRDLVADGWLDCPTTGRNVKAYRLTEQAREAEWVWISAEVLALITAPDHGLMDPKAGDVVGVLSVAMWADKRARGSESVSTRERIADETGLRQTRVFPLLEMLETLGWISMQSNGRSITIQPGELMDGSLCSPTALDCAVSPSLCSETAHRENPDRVSSSETALDCAIDPRSSSETAHRCPPKAPTNTTPLTQPPTEGELAPPLPTHPGKDEQKALWEKRRRDHVEELTAQQRITTQTDEARRLTLMLVRSVPEALWGEKIPEHLRSGYDATPALVSEVRRQLFNAEGTRGDLELIAKWSRWLRAQCLAQHPCKVDSHGLILTVLSRPIGEEVQSGQAKRLELADTLEELPTCIETGEIDWDSIPMVIDPDFWQMWQPSDVSAHQAEHWLEESFFAP